MKKRVQVPLKRVPYKVTPFSSLLQHGDMADGHHAAGTRLASLVWDDCTLSPGDLSKEKVLVNDLEIARFETWRHEFYKQCLLGRHRKVA